MNENEKRVDVVDNQEEDTAQDYISAINEIKKNSVTRESYEKLKRENKQLLDTLVQGKELEITKVEPKDVNKLRKELFNKDSSLSNLEYITTALELRDALLEAGERDPFLPYGEKVNLTAEHYENAEKVATVLQECVDFAEGDSGIFTAELQRRTKDVMPRYGKR